MRLKTYHAQSMSDAMRLVRDQLGPDAIIVATHEDEGAQDVRITAAVEQPDPDYGIEPEALDIVDRLSAVLAGHGAPMALVDRLLARPEHGERWGRHWLDIARFGESDGFERNGPRKSFWHYRDWVIQALNDDMPYDRFARMQIAGDVLTDGAPDGLAAVGFLVAGVHNTVVGSSERMRLLAREDELEEIVGTEIGRAHV